MRNNSYQVLKEIFPYVPQEYSVDCLEHYLKIVIGPAYKDFTPRNVKGSRKEQVKQALEWLSEQLYRYINGETLCRDGFEKWHSNTCNGFIDEYHKYYKDAKIQYGKAQKILNMSLKYIFCFFDSQRVADKFQFCHMPLDAYTLEWFCECILPCINKDKRGKGKISVTKIKDTSWSKLNYGSPDEEYSYLWLQKKISDYLSSDNNTEYKDANGNTLTPFQAEFFIWPEQHLRRAIKDFLGTAEQFCKSPSLYCWEEKLKKSEFNSACEVVKKLKETICN